LTSEDVLTDIDKFVKTSEVTFSLKVCLVLSSIEMDASSDTENEVTLGIVEPDDDSVVSRSGTGSMSFALNKGSVTVDKGIGRV